MRKASFTLIAILYIWTAGSVLCAATDNISVEQQQGKVMFIVGEHTIATYVYEDRQILRPYFTNLKTPGNVQVTRNHPPRKNIDADDHATMHPGLWLAFGDISGNDFWRNKARVTHVSFTRKPYAGRDHAGFAVLNSYMAEEKEICREICTITIHLCPEGYLILWASEFTSDSDPFYFGDQEEMGLGVRLATPLVVKNKKGGRILDDKGNLNEKNIWGKPSLWCDYAGPIEGVFAGVMIIPDPGNFAPCRWHVRDYGFMTANPFGKKAFNLGDEGKTVVAAGKSLSLGFGVLVHGAGNEELIDLNVAYQNYLSLRTRIEP